MRCMYLDIEGICKEILWGVKLEILWRSGLSDMW